SKAETVSDDFEWKVETKVIPELEKSCWETVDVHWSGEEISIDNVDWSDWLGAGSMRSDRSLDGKLVKYGYCLHRFDMSTKFDNIHLACLSQSIKRQLKKDPSKVSTKTLKFDSSYLSVDELQGMDILIESPKPLYYLEL